MKNDVISPEFDENGRPLRRIRSFVRRQGRLTKGQQHALDNYWPVMGVEFNDAPLDFAALFGREAPVTLEIGFGMGASLVAMAKEKPQQNFLGIEVHSPGVGACLASAEEEGVQFAMLSAPLRFNGNDEMRLTSVTLQKMELGEPDASGRRPRGSRFRRVTCLGFLRSFHATPR